MKHDVSFELTEAEEAALAFGMAKDGITGTVDALTEQTLSKVWLMDAVIFSASVRTSSDTVASVSPPSANRAAWAEISPTASSSSRSSLSLTVPNI